MRTVEFEGVQHQFPDDFTDQDISKALASLHPARPAATPAPPSSGLAPYLPAAGALLGTIGGGIVGGPPGGLLGATLGGTAGKFGEQALNGQPLNFPQAAGEGNVQAALELGGLGIAKAAGPVARVVGFGVNNRLTRAIGKAALERLVPAPARAILKGGLDVARQPLVEDVAAQVNPLGRFAPAEETTAQLGQRIGKLERRLTRVREHIREVRPRAPKPLAAAEGENVIAGKIEPAQGRVTSAPPKRASTPELARRTAARARAVGKNPPASGSDIINQMQATEAIARMAKSSGKSVDEILRFMRGQ